MSPIFGLWSSYMLEYYWLFALLLRSARYFTGVEGKWTPLPPMLPPSSISSFVYFKWVDWMVCELYLRKTSKNNKILVQHRHSELAGETAYMTSLWWGGAGLAWGQSHAGMADTELWLSLDWQRLTQSLGFLQSPSCTNLFLCFLVQSIDPLVTSKNMAPSILCPCQPFMVIWADLTLSLESIPLTFGLLSGLMAQGQSPVKATLLVFTFFSICNFPELRFLHMC